MIIIRADHDIQTHYLYTYSEEIIEEARKKNLNPVRIEGKDITMAALRSRIKHKKPKFIFFNGHGSATSLYNNQRETFVDVKSSDVF